MSVRRVTRLAFYHRLRNKLPTTSNLKLRAEFPATTALLTRTFALCEVHGWASCYECAKVYWVHFWDSTQRCLFGEQRDSQIHKRCPHELTGAIAGKATGAGQHQPQQDREGEQDGDAHGAERVCRRGQRPLNKSGTTKGLVR